MTAALSPRTLGERLVQLEGMVRELERDLRRMVEEIFGDGGRRKSLRERVEKLEDDAAAAVLAEHTLAVAEEKAKRRRSDSWGWRERVLLAFAAVVAMILPVLNLVLNLR